MTITNNQILGIWIFIWILIWGMYAYGYWSGANDTLKMVREKLK